MSEAIEKITVVLGEYKGIKLPKMEVTVTEEELQEELKRAESFGVKFTGCIACAEELNLADKMKEIGLDLYKWGPPLTELIKSGAPLLTI